MPKTRPDIFEGQAFTAEQFLSQYWQKQPCVFKNTGLDLTALPNREQLFDLAEDHGVQSRIVYTTDDVNFQAIYDEPEAWDEVLDFKPTLLVSDIEKWHPAARQLLLAFPFIKHWRFDDLMMSYAPKGASVGAHTDHYDVFLLQVSGHRHWGYDNQPLPKPGFAKDSELSVLKNHQAQNQITLAPGDMLYLPPEIAHHGISASDDCITCSIGMRAPSDTELLMAMAESISEQWPDAARLKDNATTSEQSHGFGSNEIAHLRQIINKMKALDDQELANAFGQYITSYRNLDDCPEVTPNQDAGRWKKNAFACFTYHVSDDQASLFVNGEQFGCSLWLAQYICDNEEIEGSELSRIAEVNLDDHDVIRALLDSAYLH